MDPIMSYTNLDIFREKGAKFFSKKVWELLNFMKKAVANTLSNTFIITYI
jgi:hypothetical protein